MSVPELQGELVRYLLETTAAYAEVHDFHRVGISVGAAMNGHSGMLIASAPLWGEGRWPLPLRHILARAAPDIDWTVVNDVTAQAVSLLPECLPGEDRVAALTVSTGIAYRTIEAATGRVPLDPEHGLQGEIGHLPGRFIWRGVEARLDCDCGTSGHVSSFASGRGMERLLRLGLAEELQHLRSLPALTAAVQDGDPVAIEFLDACTESLASVLLAQAALDPTVGRTIVMGGVAHAFGEAYRSSLLRHLEAAGLYMVSDAQPDYFRRRILMSRKAGEEALLGAGISAFIAP